MVSLLTVAEAEIRQLRAQQDHVRACGEGVLLPNASEELQQSCARLLGLVYEGYRVVHADYRHRVVGLHRQTRDKRERGNMTNIFGNVFTQDSWFELVCFDGPKDRFLAGDKTFFFPDFTIFASNHGGLLSQLVKF